jgi:5-hydroxyisourate hydrolase-like protein (transthyretin family)
MTERCRDMRSSHHGFSVLSILSVLSASLSAQSTSVTGRVVAADSTTPVSSIPVTLHRVGQDSQGPLDSTRSDQQGRFQFVFRADTSAFYLASGRYAGIEYFSQPLPTNPARADTSVRIVVYDTSSAAPVVLEARHLVLTRPTDSGSRGVVDLIVLRNTGTKTRVAPDTLRNSWSTALPQHSAGLEVLESDVSEGSISRSGDSLVVSAALAPGEKQLTLQYQILPGTGLVELLLGADAPSVNVLIEEPGVRVRAPGIALADSQTIQGRTFQRWTGTVLPGTVLRLELPGNRGPPPWLLAVLVGTLALALLGAGGYTLTRRPVPQGQPAADALIGAIAALDARYAGRQAEMQEEEWTSYQAERSRLKGQLQSTLASGGWSR